MPYLHYPNKYLPKDSILLIVTKEKPDSLSIISLDFFLCFFCDIFQFFPFYWDMVPLFFCLVHMLSSNKWLDSKSNWVSKILNCSSFLEARREPIGLCHGLQQEPSSHGGCLQSFYTSYISKQQHRDLQNIYCTAVRWWKEEQEGNWSSLGMTRQLPGILQFLWELALIHYAHSVGDLSWSS